MLLLLVQLRHRRGLSGSMLLGIGMASVKEEGEEKEGEEKGELVWRTKRGRGERKDKKFWG